MECDYNRAIEVLRESRRPFRIVEITPPPLTAQDVADASGVPLESVVKTVAFIGGAGEIVLACCCGDEHFDVRGIEDALQLKRKSLRLMGVPAVKELLGVEPGAVTPLGFSPPVKIVASKKLSGKSQDLISIGSGMLGKGFVLSAADFLALATPVLLDGGGLS